MDNYEALVHAGFDGKPDVKRADVLAWLEEKRAAR